MSQPTPPGWYPHPQSGSVAWWDGTAFVAPPGGQPAPPPPPAGWYGSDSPGLERWWDGFRWTDQVRPTTHADLGGPTGQVSASSRPTELVQLERITWAGVSWGGAGGSALSIALGAVFVLIAVPPLLFAVMADEVWRAVFMVVIALVLLVGAAALFVNAHFCRVLERRRHAAGPTTPWA